MDDQSRVDPFSDRELPRDVEARVLHTLRGAGLLETRAVRLRRKALGAALLAAAVVASFMAGRLQRLPAAPADSRPAFLLLLYEDAGYRDDRPLREIVAEHGAWADSLRRAGALVVAEKLSDTHVTLPEVKVAGSGPHQVPTGLFIVRARNVDDATALAESSPHLRYGGRILLIARRPGEHAYRSEVPMSTARGCWPFVASVALALACAEREAVPIRTEGRVAMDDGVHLSYRAYGDGPNTVIVPMAIYVEDALAPLASASRRLVFYDPRHRGRSERGSLDSVSLDRQLRDLDLLRAHLGADSVALIGWSGLGMEMAAYAIRHPGRVTRLVQVSPVPPAASMMREMGDQRAIRTDTAAISALDARYDRGEFKDDPARFCRERNELTLPGSLHKMELKTQVPDVCVFENEWPDHVWPYFGRLLRSFGDYDWRPALQSLTIPRLVIHGTEDGIPMAGAEAWAAYPTARLIVLDSASHFPFIERREAFLSAVNEFLDGRWPAR